jgi:hypothetical protein
VIRQFILPETIVQEAQESNHVTNRFRASYEHDARMLDSIGGGCKKVRIVRYQHPSLASRELQLASIASAE